MSNPSLIDVRDELSSHDYLMRMQSAFQKPLGGPTEARQVYAQVIGVDNKEVHFTNLETKLDFTMPLNVFLLSGCRLKSVACITVFSAGRMCTKKTAIRFNCKSACNVLLFR